MKRTRRSWPSAGFVFMLASYGCFLAFFVWGARTPELDRAWHVLEGMKRDDFAGLAPTEARLLSTVLRRHPGFAQALIGRAPVGWVEPTESGWMALRRPHVVIQAKPARPLHISVECRAPRTAYPVTVTFVAPELHQVLRYERDGPQSFDLSAGHPAQALWAEVELDSAHPAGARGPELRLLAATAPEVAP
jgi:hypothetical protein